MESSGYKIDLLDLDEEIEDRYILEYSSQLLGTFHKEGFLTETGEKVSILAASDNYVNFHLVKIQTASGEIKEIDNRKISFDYNKVFKGAHINRL